MAEQKPQLDHTAINLPSDKITMGQIRREQPEVFEPYISLKQLDVEGLDIVNLIATEILLAKDAYAKAIGISDTENQISQEDRRRHMECLNDDYRHYGISTGMAKTKQLIRDMERQAVKQAKQR